MSLIAVQSLSKTYKLRHTTAPLTFGFISPLAGLAFLYLSSRLWKWGVRHYCSTGS